MRGYTACASLVVWIWNGVTLAQSNIDPGHAFSWGENIGWLNWRCDPENGVVVRTQYLSGYIWAENAGWIDLGDGNGPYGNGGDTDFGVNLLPNGDLDGLAWGENIGWINFNTAGHAPDQARFDFVAGRFRGYAWGENIGWINLNHAEHFVAVVPDAPQPDQSGFTKCRFVSFVVTTSQESAIRVTSISLHRVDPPYTGGASVPFSLFEGQSMFVGPPTQCVESASSGIPFYASQLQCAPEYRDWSTVGLLHVMGEAVVPSSVYNVESLAASCAGGETTCTAVSAPLEIKTTRWGDVETPFYEPAHPDVSQPDTSDISSLVNKFKSALGAPIKARALLAGGNARGTIGPAEISPDFNFTHISLCVDAFKGLPYPYKPGKCTGDAAKACISDADCTTQGTTGPCILCP